MTDPLFGQLQHQDGFWRSGPIHRLLGRDCFISIEATADQGIEPAQHTAFRAFLALEPALYEPITLMLADYYNSVRPIYAEIFAEHGLEDQLSPLLQSPSDIWALLEFPSLFIPLQDTDWRVELHFETRWDVEHGLKVVIGAQEHFAVGTQSEFDPEAQYNSAGQRITT
jgi:hypothetical protein